MGHLCAKFGIPAWASLFSTYRPDVRDRQTAEGCIVSLLSVSVLESPGCPVNENAAKLTTDYPYQPDIKRERWAANPWLQ